MAIDLVTFSQSLLAFIAAATSLQAATPPRALGLGKMIDAPADAANPYTVLTSYAGGGSLPWTPVPVASFQALTVGTSDAASMQQAQAVFNALTDSSARPLRDQAITGFRLSVLNLRLPGVIGRDEKQRAQVVFNFDARFIATA